MKNETTVFLCSSFRPCDRVLRKELPLPAANTAQDASQLRGALQHHLQCVIETVHVRLQADLAGPPERVRDQEQGGSNGGAAAVVRCVGPGSRHRQRLPCHPEQVPVHRTESGESRLNV